MFNAIDFRLLGLVVTLVVISVAELGYQVAKRSPATDAGSAGRAGIQAAMFTVVGLLLAFSFSLALGRFDARRTAVITEANAIGSTIMRCDLLDDAAAARMRSYLKDYLEQRIAFVAADADDEARSRADRASDALQRSATRIGPGQPHAADRRPATIR